MEVAQAVGRGHGARRLLRGFDRVDVVVVGARMIRPAGQRLLEHAEDLAGPRLGRAVFCQKSQGMEVHQRLGQQHLDFGVVRVFGGERPHGFGISLVERPRSSGGFSA